jgi:hypothetical protein
VTTPLGASSLPARTAEFRPVGSLAPTPPSATETVSAQARWTTPPQARPTPDHLALIQALIQAGQFTRGVELLDAVWHHDLHDERCWYLRLWLLAGQGRVLEALDLARVATGHLPGSAAIAYLRAALEQCAGDPEAAVESALHAAAIAPGDSEAEAMLELVLDGHRAPIEDPDAPPPQRNLGDPPVNPVAAALAGLALLHPAGSELPYRPSLPAFEPPVADERHHAEDTRRIGLIAVATVVAAIWAVRQPLLATAGLAAVVAWLSRPSRSRRS